jgi:phosphoglycerol transferase MdoB-like AlkP superfamily enzyme
MLKLIRIVFYTILFLFVLDIINVFQTKIDFLKLLIYYGVAVLPILLLVMEFRKNRNSFRYVFWSVIPILTIVSVVYLNPYKLLFNIEPWKTQTVKFINENDSNRQVEFQMKDIGALGYGRRDVEIYYLTSYFYIVLNNEYDEQKYIGNKWTGVDLDINEIELFY